MEKELGRRTMFPGERGDALGAVSGDRRARRNDANPHASSFFRFEKAAAPQ
jgi:hypothetical protein